MKSTQSPFGVVPVEVCMDQRLTLQQMRVLLALYTFRNRGTQLAHPTREQISARTGMALSKISVATTDLQRLGWLSKVGNGGRSRATTYRIDVPQALQGEVTQAVAVANGATVTYTAENAYRAGHQTLSGAGRGKEQTIQTKTDQERSVCTLRIPGVSQELLDDFRQVRSDAKRGRPLTQTFIDGMTREAGKVGLTLDEAMRACCEFEWYSFNAHWYASRMAKGVTATRTAAVTSQKTFAQRDYADKSARWEKLTGCLHPDRLTHETAHDGLVIDMHATQPILRSRHESD
mgnify:CR=1 FL=1